MTVYSNPRMKGPVRVGPNKSDVLSAKNHEKLVKHLHTLLARDAENRAERISHMTAVEYDLLGVVDPTGSDCDRATNRTKGKSVSVPDHIYPFGYLTLQKFTSELLAVLMPTEQPYTVVTGPEKQEMANALALAFRHQGTMFDHRNNVMAAIFDAVALDCSGGFFEWSSIGSAQRQESLLGNGVSTPHTVTGFKFHHIDPYNLSWDSSVTPSEVELHGEFIAEFQSITPFRLKREAASGKVFTTPAMLDDIINSAHRTSGPVNSSPVSYTEDGETLWHFYEPKIAQSRARVHKLHGSNINQTSFAGLFSGSDFNSVCTKHDGRIHRVRMMVRIQPHEFGLTSIAPAAPAPFEIWEIHLTGAGIITYARPAPGKADRLPGFVATMNFHRQFGRSMKHGEHAAQLGLLASTIMNMHKRAMRKGLEGGVTLYNAKVVPLDTLDEASGGLLPVRMAHHDDSISNHVLQLKDVPDTTNSLRDAQAIAAMMDGMFPTNSQPAMAGLDRATTYQAQAVMLTAMRSLIYYATTLDGQMFVPFRFHMQHLNLLNPQAMTYIDPAKQQVLSVAAAEMESSGFVLTQSQALIGVDRLGATTELRDMINVMFQSGGQLPPLAGLFMKHYMQMSSLHIDPAEYEAALQKQMERDAQIQAAQGVAAEASAGIPPAAPNAPV